MKQQNLFLLNIIICIMIFPFHYVNAGRHKATANNFPSDSEVWQALSLREKIGLTMIMVADYPTHITRFGSLKKMIQQYPVGGIFLPAWILGEYKPQSDVLQNLKKVVAEYEAASNVPLIITEDFEHGVGASYSGYSNLPVLMSLGAANNTDLSWKYGNIIAKESSSLGVNWLLHPVADLNQHPLQDLVVERAVSDQSQRAYPLLRAQIEGMYAAGVVATIKHFPGDGATIKNQHMVTSANNLDIKQWNASYGKLFQKLINDGIPCIMVGHLRFPAYQTRKIKGLLPPATLSEEIITTLLKKEMKFNGAVMSDALNMGGIGGFYPNALETSIEAFKAGIDLILWPSFEFMDTLELRIKRGEIPMERLNDAVRRIWGVREKYGLITKKISLFYNLSESEKNSNKINATDIAQQAITLISDHNKDLPLTSAKVKKIAIVNISHHNLKNKLETTRMELRNRGFEVDTIIHNPSWWAWQNKVSFFEKYDRVIVAFGNSYLNPIGASLLKDNEALGIWTVNMIPFEKIIAISYSNPYYVDFYCHEAPLKINAYSIDSFTQEAVVKALTGEIPFRATSPVIIEHKILK